MKFLLTNVFFSIIFIQICNGQSGCFQGPISYSFGHFTEDDYIPGFSTTDMDTGDFNNDGIPDVLFCNGSEGKIKVYLGIGEGGFEFSNEINFWTYDAEKIVVYDYDHDGNEDFLCYTANDYSGYYYYDLYKGLGNGTFTGVSSFSDPEFPYSLSTYDFNQDGFSDLLITYNDYGESGFKIRWGDISNEFTLETKYEQSLFCQYTTTADFNMDGKMDIVSANDSGTLEIYFGNGLGNFNFGKAYVVDSLFLIFITTGDLNNDGFVDIIASSRKNLAVLLNDGTGTNFMKVDSPGTSLPSVSFIKNVSGSVADFNNDGFNDLIIGCFSMVDVFTGLGNGKFKFQSRRPVGGDANKIILDDTNDNSKQDVIVMNNNVGGFSVLLDDSLDTFRPKGIYVNQNSPYSASAADFNNDSKTDIVGSSGTTHVFFQITPDSFALIQTIDSIIYWPRTFPCNLNNDGAMDLLLAPGINSGSRLLLFFNNGNGLFFDSLIVDLPYGIADITLNDFNGDGLTDIAAAHYNLPYVSIILNQGANQFTVSQTINTTYNLRGITSADFNGDSIVDLGFVCTSEYVLTLLGIGNGSFLPPIALNDQIPGEKVVAIDFDHDSDYDLVETLLGGAKAYLLANDGTGNFTKYDSINIHGSSSFISKTDFNNDGWMDLLVYGGQTKVFLGDSVNLFEEDGIDITMLGITRITRAFPIDFDGDSLADILITDQTQIYLVKNNLAVITPSTATICNGSSVTLSSSNGLTYNWSTGETTQSITVNQPGSYTVETTNYNLVGCTSTSNPVVVSSQVPIPVIYQSGDTLISNYATGNQWYNQSGEIPGATNSTYVALLPDIYYVIVTDSNGCKSFPSDSIEVVLSSVFSLKNNVFSVQPNPASDRINFISSLDFTSETKLQIYNSQGILFYSSELKSQNNSVHVSMWPEGLYYYRVANTAEGTFVIVH